MSFGWDLRVNVKRLKFSGRSAWGMHCVQRQVFLHFFLCLFLWLKMRLVGCHCRFGLTSMACLCGWVSCVWWKSAAYNCNGHNCPVIFVGEIHSSHKRTWGGTCSWCTTSLNAERKGATDYWTIFYPAMFMSNFNIQKWQVGMCLCVCLQN